MTPCTSQLRDAFEAQIVSEWPEVVIHGQQAPRLPNTSSIAFPGIDAAGMLIVLDQAGVACSAGSACHTATLHPSHVLEAMGFDAPHAASTLRFSFSRMNTAAEARQAAEIVLQSAQKLRSLLSGGPPIRT
jgi:cysteine desulfurase